MKYSELKILQEDVSIYLACSCSNVSDVDDVLMESGLNTSINLNNDNLKDPLVVSKLKKDIQSAKKWDKVLKVIQRLNMLIAGGVLVGGSANIAYDTKLINSGDYINGPIRYDISITKQAMGTMLLLNTAIAVLSPLLKKAIRNREITNITTVRSQIDSSIALYEKQIKGIKSEDDKKKIQDAIDRLKDLQEVMDSESERLVNEDKPKSGK